MAQKPVPVLRKELDATQLIRESDKVDQRPLLALEVLPLSQPHFSLGNYSVDDSPIGFTIEISPEDEYLDNVVVQITRLTAAYDEFELVLHIANYGNEPLSIDVFRIVRESSQREFEKK
jgi:hypothetical protein